MNISNKHFVANLYNPHLYIFVQFAHALLKAWFRSRPSWFYLQIIHFCMKSYDITNLYNTSELTLNSFRNQKLLFE